MRILIYNWKDLDHPASGGAEVLTHEIAKRWIGDDHSVTQFCSQFPGSDEEAERDGVRIVRRGGRFGVYSEARRFWRENDGGFDVVIDEINTRPFMTPKFVRGVPVVALIHQLAADVWNEEMPAPIALIGRYVLEPRWLRAYRTIPTLTVSESTKSDLERFRFQDVTVIPEGLQVKPLSAEPPKEATPTLLFVGRLVKTKRPHHAIEAFRQVRQVIPTARLWMVGDGYMRRQLENDAPAGVTFYGQIANTVKWDLMRRAHLLLVPGVREGWGLVVTEANAMGTPAIGYRIPGLRDSIVHRSTGLLVDPTPSQMADAVRVVFQDKALPLLSTGARQWAERFTWEKTAQAAMSVIERLQRHSYPPDRRASLRKRPT